MEKARAKSSIKTFPSLPVPDVPNPDLQPCGEQNGSGVMLNAGATAEQIDAIPTVLVGGPGGNVEKDCRSVFVQQSSLLLHGLSYMGIG